MVPGGAIAHAGAMTNRASTTPTPPPLPPPPQPTGDPVSGGFADRMPGAIGLFALTTFVGLLAALAAGVPIGMLVGAAALDDCSPSDGWCGLGAAIMGFFLGALAGGIAYIAAGVAIVRRFRAAGHRAGQIAAHLVAPVALLLLAGFLAAL